MGGENEKSHSIFVSAYYARFLMINLLKRTRRNKLLLKNNNNFHFIKEKALKNSIDFQKENIIHILMKLTKVKLLINPVDRNDC